MSSGAVLTHFLLPELWLSSTDETVRNHNVHIWKGTAVCVKTERLEKFGEKKAYCLKIKKRKEKRIKALALLALSFLGFFKNFLFWAYFTSIHSITLFIDNLYLDH